MELRLALAATADAAQDRRNADPAYGDALSGRVLGDEPGRPVQYCRRDVMNAAATWVRGLGPLECARGGFLCLDHPHHCAEPGVIFL